jgi:hypothetical protein
MGLGDHLSPLNESLLIKKAGTKKRSRVNLERFFACKECEVA